MKRHTITVLSVLLLVSLMSAMTSAMAQAQVTPQSDPRIEQFINQLREGQRGGGRGTPAVWVNPPVSGAWWTNTALVQRLGLTDDQKAKIERAFENHRLSIVTNTATLEKEEAQLTRLLEAEPLDRNAVLTQIDRVVQARGEVERANSAMTLEMREYLTRAQWQQLQSPAQRLRVGANAIAANLISRVEPVYPEAAKQARIQGIVVLEIEISAAGTVDNARVITGHPLLIQAAIDAVKQWRYKPTLLNGQPSPMTTTVTMNFALSGDGNSGERGTPSAAPQGAGQRRGGRQQ
jgi:TonB family protein